MRDVGLNRTVIEGPPILLPLRSHTGLLEAVSEMLGERHLGAIMARDFAFDSLRGSHPYSSYALGASRLDLGLQRASRALPFLQRGTEVRTRQDGQNLVFSYGVNLGNGVGIQLLEQEIPPVLIALVRPFLGPNWLPDWIEMPEAHRLQKPALARLFGTEIRANAALPGIAIPLSLLRTPSGIDHNERLQMTISGIRGLRINRPPRTQVEIVRQALRTQLNMGSASVEDVAMALGVGVRTLQRQLRTEGSSFKEIAQSEQVDRARMLLSEGDLSIAQVAFYLGFTEVNSFRRAFRSWFGQSPTQFRSRSAG
ncbi:helix-turn-helix transcriptional regulator [Aliiruegeria lutimaris]|uniref:AraC-type DNA-binding protein n=1 Tax=Aliiruegeria lutimaris TaxID=571298 RepID=A0A1G9F853_9RHOB|nr:AraC family transcriptional regulator [Aliiruegeria lutimaris]SDK84579.1 AraC-type DNA-binding protein [Aliiruegeria lutimaris]